MADNKDIIRVFSDSEDNSNETMYYSAQEECKDILSNDKPIDGMNDHKCNEKFSENIKFNITLPYLVPNIIGLLDINERLIESILNRKDFNALKCLANSLDDINEYVINTEDNALNLLHICVASKDQKFGVQCTIFLLSIADIQVNCLAKIESVLHLTAAHIAVQWKRLNTLKILIDFGIDLCIYDSNGDTVLEYAIRNGNPLIVQMIETALRDDFEGLDARTDWDNCSQNNLISNISYEKTDLIKSCFSDGSDRTETYVYNDRDHNVVLIEERYKSICIDNSDSDQIFNSTNVILKADAIQTNSDKTVDDIIRQMSDTTIVDKLKAMGDSPGPVVASTRNFYVNRLLNLIGGTSQSPSKKVLPLPHYSEQLNRLIGDTFPFEECQRLEQQLKDTFENDISKPNYFNYILMDPNITRNIPLEMNNVRTGINSWTTIDKEMFIRFIRSIFYVGKGQGNRVYDHFYESIKTQLLTHKSPKTERILQIWESKKGVIYLRCFHGIHSNKAFAREALIIEAIGLSNLTNQISGHKKWRNAMKWSDKKMKVFGTFLLFKAFRVYLLTSKLKPPKLQAINGH